MNYISYLNISIPVSIIGLGCMRFANLEQSKVNLAVETAIKNGINFFDHADIYGQGDCEIKFAQAMKDLKIDRSKIVIQSKCGIRDGWYDSSKQHILFSVDEILKRLDTDYLDILLIHRPDALADSAEIAQAFDELYRSGKVKAFGVSNHHPNQIELIKKYSQYPIVANQMQMSLATSPMISFGMNVNTLNNEAISRDLGLLDYCQLNNIRIQAWSPFQFGFFNGVFINHPEFKTLNQVMGDLGDKYHVSKTAIAIAWLLRHPAIIQPIIGSVSSSHIIEACEATTFVLEKKEWYDLYLASGAMLP